jgi:hypothetical protein
LSERAGRRALGWLAAGAAAGIALATATLMRVDPAEPVPRGAPAAPADAVALVNGQPISREALARFTAAVARERGRLELDPAQQRRILDRLIDEELLLQRGIALGLERREPAARRAIVSAVVDGLTTGESNEPDRAALEAFLRENAAAWTVPGRITVEAARVPFGADEAAAARRAGEIAGRARAGEPLAVLAEPLEPPLPAGPSSPESFRDRAGAAVLGAVQALEPGQVSEPVRAMDGFWVVRLLAREPDALPPLDQVYEPVRQAWIQREHERRLGEAIARMRAGADVELLDSSLAAE